MALRRPAAPHLRAGRPGAPTPPASAPAPPVVPTEVAPVADDAPTSIPTEIAPMAPAASAASAPQTPAPPLAPEPVGPISAPAPATPARSLAGRRTVLLVGAAAAVGGTIGVTGLLRGAGVDLPPFLAGGARVSFSDVDSGDPAAAAIRWAHETGVQPATSATAYSPHAPVTRGQAALALHRLAGAPAVDLAAAPALFTDLGDEPATDAALLWLHGHGALWGDAELRVHPDEPATRGCTAMMLTALMRPALAGMGVTWDPSPESSLPQAEVADPALADVAWLTAAGMVPALESLADWAGEEGVTRADLALSLHRADQVIASALG